MTDKKISELTNITGSQVDDANDELPIVDASSNETKAITRVELFKGIDGDITLSGEITADKATLDAIAETKADTAVDVFVYDTSQDSDGGTWRHRTQHTSWYNETLNTATRGARREFPAVAVIVAEADKVTIYDGDDPALPMWMVFTGGTTSDLVRDGISSLAAQNAEIVIGDGGTNGVLVRVNFLSERIEVNFAGVVDARLWSNVANRNVQNDYISDSTIPDIVDRYVNDVAMTVLPDAPIDEATGLPVPATPVGTDGGLSVITDDGNVYDSADTSAVLAVEVNSRGVWWITATELLFATWDDVAGGDGFGDVVGSTAVGAQDIDLLTDPETLQSNGGELLIGGPSGVMQVVLDYSDFTKSISALTTSEYPTSLMPGDIKGAFLSDTDDTDLVGGTDADRSVNGNDLTVNGTITREPVATGADLVAYSGVSSSNYLEQPYNPDLDFGTGDFCVMGWVDRGTDDFGVILDRSDGTSAGRFKLDIFPTTTVEMRLFLKSSIYVDTTLIPQNRYSFLCAVRRSGSVEFYLNGVLSSSHTATDDIDGSVNKPKMTVGIREDLAQSLEGSLALLRISATAPTPEQIKRIYEDEKFLFQENAQATLYGTSDAVNALAHDPVTDLLHVGTSDGRSVFQGLRRVDNTTDAVSTAISASNNLIVEQ